MVYIWCHLPLFSKQKGFYFESKSKSHLPRLHKSFGHFAVAAAVTRRYEIGHSAALQKGCRGHGTGGAEDAGEGDHLHQTQPDHRSLGVVPKAKPVAEPCADCDDVLTDEAQV